MHSRLERTVITVILASILVTPLAASAAPWEPDCLYPSQNDRFGITTSPRIAGYDATALSAGGYLDWLATPDAPHPNRMIYYPMVHSRENSYFPRDQELEDLVQSLPGALWVMGNEVETVWMDHTTPESYARNYHDIHEVISNLDPTARFAFGGTATVTTLRLAWLDRAWTAYQSMYGTEMPVDVWNLHSYVVNEMHNEWGAEIPTGIDNAVGYTQGHWELLADPGAGGGTVHQSRTRNAMAYFAFHGSSVTLRLRTGPDAGIAEVTADPSLFLGGQWVGQTAGLVDLYAPTPGVRDIVFRDLVPPGARRGDRHNVRIKATGDKNPSSSAAWVRVDWIEAPSTTSLPNGRLQDNDPMQAKIVTDVDDHDNLVIIEDQIRMFRQWMADHGQRNKPLIHTEYGILMSDELGFDEPRVRAFLQESFDRFLHDWTDAAVGYPADGNRMLQQLFWFSLAIDGFEGQVVHTGLYSEITKQIKPLGQDYASIVAPLTDTYADLKMLNFDLVPTWPLFAGDPSLVQVDARLRNWGNIRSNAFSTTLDADGQTVHTWQLPNVGPRFNGNDWASFSLAWQPVVTGDQLVTITADSTQQADDPCRSNNTLSVELVAPPVTDLAVTDLHSQPRVLPPVASGQTATIPLLASLANVGSRGTADTEIVVNFWHGDPDAGGELIGSQTLNAGNVTLPATVAFNWSDRSPGVYHIVAEIVPVSDETAVANNRLAADIFLPTANLFLPVYSKAIEADRSLMDSPEQVLAQKMRYYAPARK